jgi:hypothetical protein
MADENDDGSPAMDYDIDEFPDADMPARGSNRAPGVGKMPPRGSKKPAMDAAAAKLVFDAVYPDAHLPPHDYAGNYCHLESDMVIPASPSRQDVDSFRALFPEAEPEARINVLRCKTKSGN